MAPKILRAAQTTASKEPLTITRRSLVKKLSSLSKRTFYVDDLLKAVETPGKAISLAHELMALLEKGGFRLTKWASNSREVLASIPEDKRARPTVNLDLDELPIERVLGVLWNVE